MSDKEDPFFKDKPQNFSDLLQSKTSEDPYALQNYGETRTQGRLSMKYNRIKSILVGRDGVSSKFFMGMKMGFMIGGIFGGLMGLVTYARSRNFLHIPIMIVATGGSFGFFLGIGTLVRSEVPCQSDQYFLVSAGGDYILVRKESEWKERFRVEQN